MVTIPRLPTTTQAPQRTRRTNRKQKSEISASSAPQPTVVAQVVAETIKDPALIENARSQVQYDSPQGKNKQALSAYMDVLHQAKREEYARLLGIDLFV
ncbi:chromosome segregation ATPase [Photobacterium sp. 1_MG-2023]|uniref:chromosome segregation ATPase n=1 Tax=Photobacterium sp. 1_MG-2023 TaxID=3062646 RepID=UPI0026E2FCA5|nr:chromosome segregation ATPase [Photobacterium sp. 1_MG-2023]MDO6705722.1 chromosome segregation ATPase [Photobacterium sp. 1_MG-2023]